MKSLASAGKFLDAVAKVMTMICVAIMVLVVLAQVFMRYFLRSPLIWADEASKYMLVFMTFIGAAVALRKGELACMDLLVDKLPAAAKKVIAVIVCLANVSLLAFLFYYSVRLMSENSVLTQVSPAMRIPMPVIYSCMPIGLGLAMLQSVMELLNTLLPQEPKEEVTTE